MTATNVRVQMQQRKDTAANWASANPTLLSGELGYETDTGKWKVGTGSAAWSSLAYTNWSQISYPIATADIADDAVTGAKLANNIDIAGTLDVTSAATFDNNVVVQGNLTVNGTTTTIDTTTLLIQDKNIELGVITPSEFSPPPSDFLADGGGITLKGTTDKTITWIDATDAWTFSEHLNIVSGKEYRIAGTKVLDATSLGSAVVGSSLTSVGTIGTGVWNGTAIASAYIADSAITSAKITDGAIVDADINASAAIVDTKLGTISTAAKVSNSATTATDANTASAIVARDGSGNFAAGTVTAALTGNASTATALETARDIGGVSFDGTASISLPGVNAAGNQDTSGNAATSTVLSSARSFAVTGDVTGTVSSDLTSGASIATSIAAGAIVDADVNASAAIAGTKISPDFGSQAVTTTGLISADGKVSFPLGTAALPSLYPGSDTNTGIYSPGADQLAISTNGTERLQVDSSGNVGIGTSSPAYQLDVQGSGNSRIKVKNTSVTGESQFHHDGNGDLNIVNTVSGRNLRLFTASSERLRIDSSGNVGIGTSSIDASLHVKGAGTHGSFVLEAGGTSGATNQIFIQGHNNAGTSLGEIHFEETAVNQGAVVFKTNGGSVTERMRIDSSGRVGIGTSSPDAELHVGGSDPHIDIGPDSGNRAKIAYDSNNIYIATTSGTGQTIFKNNVSSTDNPAASGTERMRIDGSGRLLVGTSSALAIGGESAAKLQLVDASGTSAGWFNLARFSNSAGANAIQFGKSRGTTVGNYTIVQNGDTLGSITFAGADGTDLGSYGAQIQAQVDGTPGANDMPGRLVFSTTANGASAPTERMRITSTGYTTQYSTSSGQRFSVSAAAGTSASIFIGAYGATAVDTGTACYRIWSNGNVVNTNNSYTGISDIKLKENIVDASSQWDDIKALRPVNYNFKEGQTHTQLGLIAQEVELVSPGIVSESPDRDEDGNDLGTVTKSVNYSVLYMKAVKALQEAMERIETLEQRLSDAGIA